MFLLFQVQGHLRPSDIVPLSFSGQWRWGILFDLSLRVGFLLDAASQVVLLSLGWSSLGRVGGGHVDCKEQEHVFVTPCLLFLLVTLTLLLLINTQNK